MALTGAVIATLLVGIDRIAAPGSSDRHTVLGLAGGALAVTVMFGFLDSSLSLSLLT